MISKKYLTAKDIQTILQISRSKSYDIMWYFVNKGVAVRIGKCLRVEERHFNSYLVNHEV